jgi:protein O-GlcNAc transferase
MGWESISDAFAVRDEYEAANAGAFGTMKPALGKGEGRLRVGYLSAGFRCQPLACFTEPLLANHDRSRFEVVCYHDHLHEDEVTRRFKGYAGLWVPCSSMSDENLAHRIRADGIDILIGLNGHSEDNRSLTFARNPAPVQMTWLGHVGGTGGYRVTDWQADPQGYELFAAEKLLRLPASYFCYRPPAQVPDVGELPAQSNGYITFGSFNDLAQVSDATAVLWSNVLEAVPGSKLLMKTDTLADWNVRDSLLQRFAEQGVAAHRLELIGRNEDAENPLAVYNRVDIALDTWPYNGAAAMCEALWMGVPVISLEGPMHASRIGLSILNAAGLVEFAACDPVHYVALARAWAQCRASLPALRAHLRARLSTSPLMDEAAFVSTFESVLAEAAGATIRD